MQPHHSREILVPGRDYGPNPGILRISAGANGEPPGERKRGAEAPPLVRGEPRLVNQYFGVVLIEVAQVLPSFSIVAKETLAPSVGAPPSTFVLSFQ